MAITLDKLKQELVYLTVLLVIFVILFKISFYKEIFIVVLRTIISIFWLFVLPGYAVMFYWHNELDFLERLIIGSVVSMAIIGVIGYDLNLFGLTIIYHTIFVPLITICIASLIIWKKVKKES